MFVPPTGDVAGLVIGIDGRVKIHVYKTDKDFKLKRKITLCSHHTNRCCSYIYPFVISIECKLKPGAACFWCDKIDLYDIDTDEVATAFEGYAKGCILKGNINHLFIGWFNGDYTSVCELDCSKQKFVVLNSIAIRMNRISSIFRSKIYLLQLLLPGVPGGIL